MYALDTTAARKADNTGGAIKELGKYIGRITQAEDITATTGTRGIAFNFESSTGQKARVRIYTQKASGEQLMGYETLMALMTCLGLRNIEPKEGMVKYWDNDARAEATKKGRLFPELCKPIGMLLETEDYEKNDHSIGTRMVLKNVFQVPSELTASEILDRKTVPEQLSRMVAGLRHRPLKGTKPAQAPAPRAASGGGSGFDDMDDDIPFRQMAAGRAFLAM